MSGPDRGRPARPKTPRPPTARPNPRSAKDPQVPGSGGQERRRPGGRDRTGAPVGNTGRRPQPPEAPPKDVHDPDGIRLQKVLAQAGVASRRGSEILIEAGRVSVDGQIVRELGVRVDPQRQVVHVDGVRLQLDDTLVYLALNKPPGVVSTMSDPEGRPSLGDMLANRDERLFHVGRLDQATEGLIIVTNDGDLAHKLTHPSHEVPKTYLVEVGGPVGRDVGKRLRTGVELDDGVATVDSFKLVDARPGKALIEIVLHEGRNHIVRRMFEAVGYPVLQLCRTQVGPIRLADLRSGRYRAIHGAELSALFDSAGM